MTVATVLLISKFGPFIEIINHFNKSKMVFYSLCTNQRRGKKEQFGFAFYAFTDGKTSVCIIYWKRQIYIQNMSYFMSLFNEKEWDFSLLFFCFIFWWVDNVSRIACCIFCFHTNISQKFYCGIKGQVQFNIMEIHFT